MKQLMQQLAMDNVLYSDIDIKAKAAAINLIKHYVLRGETVRDLRLGQMGVFSSDYHASIGGYSKGKSVKSDKILVDNINNKEIEPQVFSLQKIYNEIKLKYGSNKS